MKGKKLLVKNAAFLFICLALLLSPSLATTTISSCSVLDQEGETYLLTTDIVNSSTSSCINISANNITLDCQNHLIDGDDNAEYGIYISRSSAQMTNVTVKNCRVSDWDEANIYIYNANGNTLENITSYSSPAYGIYLEYSDSNTLTNITTYSNDYGGPLLEYSDSNTLTNITTYSNFNGILLRYSHSNTLTSITAHSNNYSGIYLWFSNSNTLTNITTYSNSYGIFLRNSNSNTLSSITASNEHHGIWLYYSNSNTLTNITTYSNSYGIYLEFSNSNTLSSINTTNSAGYDVFYRATSSSQCSATFENVIGTGNKPIVFYNSSVTIKDWNNNVSEIILCNADNSLIENLILIGNENNGLILAGGTENTTIKNSYFQDLENGIYLYYSNSNTLSNITIYSNGYGIYLESSDSNTFSNIATYSNSGDGIYLYYSDSNTFSSITAHSNNKYGIRLSFSNSNLINNSRIYGNSQYGIYLRDAGESGANLIYNNFFNNSANVYFDGNVYHNNWNTTRQIGKRIYSPGAKIGGNFWAEPDGSGYSETCGDIDQDGFCDQPYTMNTDNIDYHPYSLNYSYILMVRISPSPVQKTEKSEKYRYIYALSSNVLAAIKLFGEGVLYSLGNSIISESKPYSSKLYLTFTRPEEERFRKRAKLFETGEMRKYSRRNFGYELSKKFIIKIIFSRPDVNFLDRILLHPGLHRILIKNLGYESGKARIRVVE